MRSINPHSRFSGIEVRDIVISTAVLTLAFVIMFRNSDFVTIWFRDMMGSSWFAGMFALMFAVTVLSFVCHEMGHKFTAQRFGMWSEYRMFPMGLGIALFMSFLGFLFAAPGAVVIRANYITNEENGRISIAGPLVNMVLAAVGIVGCLVFNGSGILVAFYLLFRMNAALALFNMLPFMPLDGAKIMNWDRGVWAACIAVAAIEFAAVWLMPPLGYTV